MGASPETNRICRNLPVFGMKRDSYLPSLRHRKDMAKQHYTTWDALAPILRNRNAITTESSHDSSESPGSRAVVAAIHQSDMHLHPYQYTSLIALDTLAACSSAWMGIHG